MATPRKPPSKLKNQAGKFYTNLAALKVVQEMATKNNESWMDSLGEAGKALREWRDSLIADLGGEEAISAQQRSIIELAAKTHLLLESVDRFLFSMPSLVKQTTRQLFPIVLQRQQLADAQVRHMNTLGLRRLAKPMTSIHEYIAQHDAAKSVASKLEEPNPAEPQT
jgi:hypothetical protein